MKMMGDGVEGQSVVTSNSETLRVSPSQVVELGKIESVKLNIDMAMQVGTHALLLVGWLYDPDSSMDCLLATRSEQGLLKRTVTARMLRPGLNGVQWCRSERVDVTQSLGTSELLGNQHGFALVLPEIESTESLAIRLKDGVVCSLLMPKPHTDEDLEKALKPVLQHSGPAIHTVLSLTLGDTHQITQQVNELMVGGIDSLRKTMSCDHVMLLEGNILIVNGWIAEDPQSIDKLEVGDGRTWYALERNLNRYMRPDLNHAFPKFGGKPLGFICAKHIGQLAHDQLTLRVTFASGRVSKDVFQIERLNWQNLYGYVQGHPSLFSPLFTSLRAITESDQADQIFRLQFAKFYNMAFDSHVRGLPTMVDETDRIIAAVDRVYTLGTDGMLVMGWMLSPKISPVETLVCNEDGDEINVQASLTRLIREDIVNAFAERVPDARPRSGFMFYLSMPTEPGDARCLKFKFALGDDVMVKLPTERQPMSGVPLIKNILGMVPHPERMQHELFDVFDKALGPALEAINQKRSRFNGEVEVRQFGKPPELPETSIIVPLYGRCDFMRHQLAQFADDPSMKRQDLIYVVDDPRILEEVHGLAAKYQWLFDVPFRVVWYGQNLGFAGANNVGARFARGQRLLLLNSDAFPKHVGWLDTLNDAMDTLPDAGAVGPLLQYADDSVQHAGMYPLRGDFLPGFLLNTHPHQGTRWEGGEEPTEHPLLTAACLLVNTEDYRELGGFDEGYVVGDFEDSDLCLALRKRGKRLYVVPASKVWHLERQSQTINQVASTRQLITLFNGWRYSKKIQAQDIADPEVGLDQFAYGAAVQPASAVTTNSQD